MSGYGNPNAPAEQMGVGADDDRDDPREDRTPETLHSGWYWATGEDYAHHLRYRADGITSACLVKVDPDRVVSKWREPAPLGELCVRCWATLLRDAGLL